MKEPFFPDTDAGPTDDVPPATLRPPKDVSSEEAPASGVEFEQMRIDLEAAQAQAAEHLATAQRTIADFANYRRRTSEEREAENQNATEALLVVLLPVLDDFDRANSALPPELRDSTWVSGIAVIERKLRAALESCGVSLMDTAGAMFDPRLHEAIGTKPAAPEFEGAVVAETQHGYLRGERVLRPAQVLVGVPLITDNQPTEN